MALTENMTRMQDAQDAIQSPQTDEKLAFLNLLRQDRGDAPPTDVRPPIGGERPSMNTPMPPPSMPMSPPSMPMSPPSMPMSPPSMPMPPPDIEKDKFDTKQSLNEILTATLPGDDSLASLGLEVLVRNAGVILPEQQGLPLEAAPVSILNALKDPFNAAQDGGLMGLAVKDEEPSWDEGFSGQVPGSGHGMEDNVHMPIVERKAGDRIGTLAVSPDEYVVDAHTMSALGNGSADAGAEVMDRVVKNVRQQAFGTQDQPTQINGLAALRPMTERV